MEYVVGPVPNGGGAANPEAADGDQKDVVKQFRTSMKTGSAFYVDANGREYLNRVSAVLCRTVQYCTLPEEY